MFPDIKLKCMCICLCVFTVWFRTTLVLNTVFWRMVNLKYKRHGSVVYASIT